MSILIAALLGVVQGITEFLPVSSSAHLLLGRHALGWGEGPFGLVFDVATHLGTLVATIIYFRDDLWATLGFTVILSVVVHGVAATPVMRFLERRG